MCVYTLRTYLRNYGIIMATKRILRNYYAVYHILYITVYMLFKIRIRFRNEFTLYGITIKPYNLKT